ncbi:MAG TPA: hypothetical protein VJ835_05485 [Fimbriimonadaceae bacterium]|nr:hypothetical protein [Fimbriimonadaceae bacterium]
MKKVLLTLIPVILAGVGVGIFLMTSAKTPSKKQEAKASDLYKEKKDEAPIVAAKPKTPAIPPPTSTTLLTDSPEKGERKLAKLWNELEAPSLVAITKDWKDTDIAAILNRMDAAKVAEFLSIADPKKASSISRELQKIASKVPPPPQS